MGFTEVLVTKDNFTKYKMKITIIVPAYDEEHRIAPTLHDISQFIIKNDINAEIIVVDDGSTDATEFIANETLSKQKVPYKVVRQTENQGKGMAIATGIKSSTGDYILFTDADGSTHIKEFERFYEYINTSTLIIGSRQKDKKLLLIDQEKSRKILGNLTNAFHKLFFRLGVEDSQCGFKLLPKSLAISFIRKPFPHHWGFDIALINYANMCGFNVVEVGVQWKDIRGSKVRMFIDSVQTIKELLVYKIKNILEK